MNKNTMALLSQAKNVRFSADQGSDINSYISDITDENRKVVVKMTCRRVIKMNKRAIEILADR